MALNYNKKKKCVVFFSFFCFLWMIILQRAYFKKNLNEVSILSNIQPKKSKLHSIYNTDKISFIKGNKITNSSVNLDYKLTRMDMQSIIFQYHGKLSNQNYSRKRGLVIYRLITNDKIPQEGFGAQLHNLRQILLREKRIYDIYKGSLCIIWILDKIYDSAMSSEIKQLLKEHNQKNIIELELSTDLRKNWIKNNITIEGYGRETYDRIHKTKAMLQKHFDAAFGSLQAKIHFQWYCIITVHHMFTLDAMNELLGEINHIAAQKKYNHLTHFVIRTFKLFHPIRDHDVIKINKNLNISDDEFELRRTEPFKSYAYLEGSEVEEKIVGIVSLPDSILFHRRRIKQPYEGGIKYNLWLRTDSKVIKFLNCYGNRYDPFKEVNCIGPLYTSGYALLLYKYPTFALPLFDEHERLLKNNKYKIDNALNSNHLNETSDNIAAQANDIFNCMWNKIYPYQVNQGDPSYVIYRIYGNDLPPLQKVGQLAQNLKYTLENENKNLIGLTKRWVLNRIIDKDLEEKMLNMLQEHGYTEENGSVLVFRFDNITFKSLLSVPGSTKNLYQLNGCNPKYLEKAKKNIKILVNYAQHLNEVRNILLKHARNLVTEEPNILADTSQRMFDWILIFDGNQFITNEGWQEINSFTKYRKYRNTKVFQVPMCRIKQPQEVKWLNENSTLDNLLEQDICIMQEPQLMFRYDACMTFNLENEYGKKSKLQLLNSLGCDEPSSSSAIYCGTAGYSLRLFPFPDIESPGDAMNVITSHSKRYRLRKTAIEAFALKLWELFIALYHDKNCYNTTS